MNSPGRDVALQRLYQGYNPELNMIIPAIFADSSDVRLQYSPMKPPADCTSIDEIRQAIDELDRAIVETLGRRFTYVKAITRFKKTAEDVAAPARYQQVLVTRRTWAVEAGLNPDVIEQMYRQLIAHFIEEEMKQLAVNREQ